MTNDQEVTVQVTIVEVSRYATRVKMPVEKFERLSEALDSNSGYDLQLVEEQVGEFCDRLNDWQGSDGLEVEEFRIVEDAVG